MAKLVRDEKRLLELGQSVLVDDKVVSHNEGCSAAGEDGGARRCRLHVDPPTFGFGDSQFIG